MVIQRCVTVFLKLAMFKVVMGLTENFNVIPSKCRFDDKHHNTSLKRKESKAFQNSVFAKWASLWIVMWFKWEFHCVTDLQSVGVHNQGIVRSS